VGLRKRGAGAAQQGERRHTSHHNECNIMGLRAILHNLTNPVSAPVEIAALAALRIAQRGSKHPSGNPFRVVSF
jgi:hypothetical protein